MATVGRSQVVSYPTPLIGDCVFYELRDMSQERWANLNYGDPHPDKDKWPHHKVVSLQPVPDRGEKIYALFFAADRKHQDLYNFEHSKADLGGHKFETVTRNYVVRRSDYNPLVPALGTAMPDTPSGKFAASSFHLIARGQDRISQRGARAEATIGQAELDSLYVVDVRTYIDREPIVTSRYDDTVGGVLFTRQNIYIRGEDYGGSPIETAVGVAANWGVSSAGILTSFEQVSDDVWVVTNQDMIPQSGLPGTPSPLFGGTVIRVYHTNASYAWPTVLGDDGVAELSGSAAFEIMDWEDKEGTTRNYVRPRIKRAARRTPSLCEIHREWLTPAQMAAAVAADTFDVVTNLDPKSIHYLSPFFVVNMPPALHTGAILQADTGSGDPVWGVNVGSTRTYPATTVTDWPDFVIADVTVEEFRGGYMATRVKIFKPSS